MYCGGALHRANYPRKVRGLPPGASAGDGAGGPGPELRLSFCCAREGCRKRHTPASLRFLGRRVYAGVVLVLVMAPAARRSAPATRRGPSTRPPLTEEVEDVRSGRPWCSR